MLGSSHLHCPEQRAVPVVAEAHGALGVPVPQGRPLLVAWRAQSLERALEGHGRAREHVLLQLVVVPFRVG